jgi:vancomycin resistance protein VanW
MYKPKQRTKLRLFLGKVFYFLKKYFYWYLSGTKFAKTISHQQLPYEIFQHKSLLRRELRNVKTWMQENKINNLKLAIEKLDGLTLNPEEIFSYWLLIGAPVKRKGYLPGMILYNGKVFAGTGGGLCQLSNLIYWMTLHTPLIIQERYRHSYDVFPDTNRKQPFGTGATCAYPNIDLQVKNNTKAIFQLKLSLTKTHLVGRWFSNKPLKVKYVIEEKDHHLKHELWGGYTRNNKIFRKTLDVKSRKEIVEEFITENHAIMMYSPLLAKPQAFSIEKEK